MMTLKSRLDRIDLSANSADTVATLIKLLASHTPFSLSILGILLNIAPRPIILQNVDLSQVSLWSTIPLHPDAISITNPLSLFSIVVFSHSNRQFNFFCSGESSEYDNGPTQEEETHVKQVFEHLLEIAREALPTYNSTLVALGGSTPRNRIDTDPPMVVVGAVHEKWKHVLASMSVSQNIIIRYAFPPDFSFADEGPSLSGPRLAATLQTSEEVVGMPAEVSHIRASDLPFVYGASSIPRSEAYILSRAPYSVCLRSRGGMGPVGEEGSGQPVACALIHADGSIGALHVDPKFQRQGLGKRVIQALMETVDFNRVPQSTTCDGFRDLGGGALGWNWTDVAVDNEAGNRFFTSLVGKANSWMCHWTYIRVPPQNM